MSTVIDNNVHTSEELKTFVKSTDNLGKALAKAWADNVKCDALRAFGVKVPEEVWQGAATTLSKAHASWLVAVDELTELAEIEGSGSIRCGYPGGNQRNAHGWLTLYKTTGHPITAVRQASGAIDKADAKSVRVYNG